MAKESQRKSLRVISRTSQGEVDLTALSALIQDTIAAASGPDRPPQMTKKLKINSESQEATLSARDFVYVYEPGIGQTTKNK